MGSISSDKICRHTYLSMCRITQPALQPESGCRFRGMHKVVSQMLLHLQQRNSISLLAISLSRFIKQNTYLVSIYTTFCIILLYSVAFSYFLIEVMYNTTFFNSADTQRIHTHTVHRFLYTDYLQWISDIAPFFTHISFTHIIVI